MQEGNPNNAANQQSPGETPTMNPTLPQQALTWNQKLRAAAEGGRIDQVEACLKEFSNRKAELKQTEIEFDNGFLDAIFAAIKKKHMEILKSIIKARSSTLKKHHEDTNQTALHVAVKEGNEDILKTLLLHSRILKVIDDKDNEGRTALHEAASQDGKHHLLPYLLAAEAEIDVFDKKHRTPLQQVHHSHPPSLSLSLIFFPFCFFYLLLLCIYFSAVLNIDVYTNVALLF